MSYRDKYPPEYTRDNEDTVPLRTSGMTTFDRYENQETYESIRRRSRMRYKCFRITLAIVLGLTVLISLVFMTIGIVPLVFYYNEYNILDFVFDYMYLIIAAAACIGLGFAMLISCVLGIVGIVKLNRCVLIVFAVWLATVSCIIALGGVLCIIFRNDAAMVTMRKDNYTTAITKQYGVDVDKNPTNKLFTEVVDIIQETFECCGGYGNVSDIHSWAVYKQESTWYFNSNTRYPLVPESCCVKDGDIDICQGKTRYNGPPTKGPSKLDKTLLVNENLYTDGCYDQVVMKSKDYLFYFGIAVVSTVLFPVIAMGMSFCLACFIYRDRDY